MSAHRQEDTSPPRRVPFESVVPPSVIFAAKFYSPSELLLYIDPLYAPPAAAAGALRYDPSGDHATAGSGVPWVLGLYKVNVTPFFLWAPGGALSVDAPGWGLINAGPQCDISANPVTLLERRPGNIIRVHFEAPYDPAFIPWGLLHDDVDGANTVGPVTKMDEKVFDIGVPAGTFLAGHAYSAGSMAWGMSCPGGVIM